MDWRNQLEPIQNKLKLQLHAKKIDDLSSLYNLVQQYDQGNTGYLNKDQFEKFLSKLGVFLTTQELRAVYNTYDVNKDENIAYSEFVQLIRTTMSEKRLAVVKHAFNFLDQGRQGRVGLGQVFQQFRADQHARVKTRQKTVDQVRSEFEYAISKKSSDGQTINENEFLDYYADVNSTLPAEKEEYFIDNVLNTWGITSASNYISPERLADLEIILFEKIRQKTNTLEDEGKTARKAFKYFDVMDAGVININQFSQALDKFGCVFNGNEVQALFNKYDKNKNGKICYDEFSGLFATMGSGVNQNVNPVFDISRQPPKAIIQRLQQELKKRGVHSLRSLGRCFKRSDKNKNGVLSREEFKWALKEAGFVLTKTEQDNLFKYFDKNCDDQVSYNEFVYTLRSDNFNEARRQVVQAAFAKLDKDRSGQVTVSDLKGVYETSCHSAVKQGKKNSDEVLKEFLAQWDTLQKDGIVNVGEFEEYYRDLSANIDSDDLFIQYVVRAWKLD